MKFNLYFLLIGVCVAFGMLVTVSVAIAQQPAANMAGDVDRNNQGEGADPETEPPIRFQSPYQPFAESLMLGENELLRIRTAMAGIRNRIIDQLENEGDDAASETEDAAEPEPPRNRLIRLSGIAYNSPDRWMVWLNGMRLTPNNLLPEIVDIDVQENYIDLRWFDRELRKIVKIRMRPNQVYDLATGIMVPG